MHISVLWQKPPKMHRSGSRKNKVSVRQQGTYILPRCLMCRGPINAGKNWHFQGARECRGSAPKLFFMGSLMPKQYRIHKHNHSRWEQLANAAVFPQFLCQHPPLIPPPFGAYVWQCAWGSPTLSDTCNHYRLYCTPNGGSLMPSGTPPHM